jgi:uncharacterized protein (DUF488 family)
LNNVMLLTIGHSNHDIKAFLTLLSQNGVTAIGDVRSSPYSRYAPHYSREALKSTLTGSGIAYTFLGKELGARSDNPICYKNGKVQYDLLAQQPIFANGVARVTEGMKRYRIALMCAEKDPIECHRALLVARSFFNRDMSVSHILADGSLESHELLESRLLTLCKFPEGDMFKSRADFVSEAYLVQGDRVAYQDDEMLRNEAIAP